MAKQNVQPEMLAISYGLLFVGSVFIALLVSRSSRSGQQKQKVHEDKPSDAPDSSNASTSSVKTPQALLRDALRCHERGNDEESLDLLSKAIELDPNFISAYLTRSAVYAGRSQFQKCKEDCDKVLLIAPTNASVMVNKAVALRSMGNQREAIETCNRVLDLTQDNNDKAKQLSAALAYCNRGYSRFLLNETNEAMLDFEDSIRHSSDVAYTAKMISLHAKFLAHLGRISEAMELCNQANTVSDENEYPWRYVRSTRGLVCAMSGDFSEAMNDVDEVLRKHPKFSYAVLVKARILLLKNAPREALAVVNEAIALNDLDPECFSVRYLIRQKLGDVYATEDAKRAKELGFLRPEFV